MPNTDPITLGRLVALYGHRVSSLDARRAGVPERVHVAGPLHLVTTYLIFA